jgi:ferredoxin-NADP reductase
MSKLETKLQKTEEVAQGTMAFHFEKPAGFTFKPGQAVDVILASGSGVSADNDRHTFSIVSAPYQDELVFATRMRDSVYKRALRALAVGTAVSLDGPFGTLTLHNKRARPAVFIAGGIGITPFMSILRQAAQDQLPQDIVLLYSNHRPEDAPFLVELQRLAQKNKQFRLVATMTKMAQSKTAWDGETGLVDAQLLKKTCGALAEPIYYLAGPPAMVAALHQTLSGTGVDDDDIRSEEFFGY